MARSLIAAALVAVGVAVLNVHVPAKPQAAAKVWGLDKVFAFTYPPHTGNFDVKQLHSVTFTGPGDLHDWKYWQARGVVLAAGHTWFDLIRSPLDQAVADLSKEDYGGDPQPVVMVDEFGFDYGGLRDQKAAQVLRQTKLNKPDLGLAVFETRGPVSEVLADAYRDVAGLVMFESYVGSKSEYWLLAEQAWSARKFGLLPKTIMVLGVGKGGNPGEVWAATPEELEQQMRFVRMLTPESPGIGFYAGSPELLTAADALCTHYFDFPADGTGLPQDVRDLAQTFSRQYDKPTLVVSPSFVQPTISEDGKSLVEPKMMRIYIINLGDVDATNVKVRLRNPPEAAGNVFAEGVVPLVPKRGQTVGVLPVTGLWRVPISRWVIDMDAPGCDVLTFTPTPPGK